MLPPDPEDVGGLLVAEEIVPVGAGRLVVKSGVEDSEEGARACVDKPARV
ncbi:hypothetical protein OTB20_23155 [Streptomyces sp. H27-H1]|nr:hypothetical protein [Streptomyces sp. H27-H1]MCY0929045.1 hypothetical protein [Streptomyces sp. H27-H1]